MEGARRDESLCAPLIQRTMPNFKPFAHVTCDEQYSCSSPLCPARLLGGRGR